MLIHWDPVKAASNRRKHGIRFCDVESVFTDPGALSIEDPDSKGEHRHIVVGMDSIARLVVVVYTYDEATIRLISARKATRTESRTYAKTIRFQ